MRLSSLYFRKLKGTIQFTTGLIVATIIAVAVSFAGAETSEAKPKPVKAAKPVDTAPRYEVLYIVSEMYISETKGSNTIRMNEIIQVTDGNAILTIQGLMMSGYSHKKYSACYHEVTDPQGNVIPIYCQKES